MKYFGLTLTLTTVEDCRAEIEKLALEKASSKAQGVAETEQVRTAGPTSPLPEKRRRERPIAFSDDSQQRWEYWNNGAHLEIPNA